MMKFARISLVAVVAFVAAGVASYADDTFEYKGYMRIGSQLNFSGNAPDRFGLTRDWGSDKGGAQKWVGRLGNEDQARPYQDPFFLEQTFIKNWTHENGSFAKAVVLLNYYGKPVGDNGDQIGVGENSVDTAKNGNSALRIRQAYVEMGGFAIAPNTTFWAGKRFLNRQDIHILDWFFLDFSGNGAGVTNIANIGVDLAYIQRLADTNENKTSKGNGRTTSNNLVAKFENTLVRIDAAANFVSNGADGAKKATYSSQMLSAQYKPEKFFFILPGQSSITAQYANGAMANASWYGNRVTNNLEEGWMSNKKAEITYFTAIVTGLATVGDNININPVLAYRYLDADRSKTDGADAKWKCSQIVAATRASYNFTANVGAEVEVGYTMAKCDNVAGPSGWTNVGAANPCNWAGLAVEKNDEWSGVYKIAPSLVLTLDAGYWTRPQLRLGYVYMGADKAFKKFGTGTNTDKSSAQWLFVQAEAWW